MQAVLSRAATLASSTHTLHSLRRWLGVVLIIALLAPHTAMAADRYWAGVGADSDRWENTANWSTTATGNGGASIPGAGDVAIFTSGTGAQTARIRSAVNVYGLVLASTWSGSVLQGTGTITLGNDGAKIGSGKFIGGNAAMTVRGAWTQTGGAVTGLMNTLTVTGSLSVTKHANAIRSEFTSTGTLSLAGKADQTFTVGASVSKRFKNLTLNNTGGGTIDDIIANISGGLFLSGALTITLGNLDLTTNSVALVVDSGATLANSAQATLTTNSNMTVSGSILVNDAATITVSAGTLTLNDDGDQAFDIDGQSLFNLTLNNTGGGTNDDIVVAGGKLQLSGALTVTLGNLDLTTNSLDFVTERGVTLANAAQATLTTNSNVTASGSITVNDAATLTVTGGRWTLNDDSDQSVDLDGQPLFNLTINNTGGGTNDDIVIAADSQLLLSGSLTITLGNLDLTTNTEAMVVESGATLADAAQATLTTNSNVTASGSILVNDAATITVSAGTWTLNDNGDQAFDIDGQPLYNLTLNNTGGGTNDDIVVAGGKLQLSGALTVTLGNLDLTTNSLDIVVERGITVADAAQATFSGDDVTASGSITTNAAGSYSMAAGTTLIMQGYAQTLDVNQATITAVTVSTGSTTTLGANLIVPGTLRVHTGATLALSSFKLYATGSLVINFGTITENTGFLSHSGANVLITDSSYAESATITAECGPNSVFFTATDADGNLSGTAQNTFSVTVTTATGDSESVTLTETTKTSGIFRGSLIIVEGTPGTNNNDGRLQSKDDTSATITYTDAQDGLVKSDSATYDVTCILSTGVSGGGGGGGGGGGVRSTSTSVGSSPPPSTPTPKNVPVNEKKETLREKRLREAQEKRTALMEKRKVLQEKRKAQLENRKASEQETQQRMRVPLKKAEEPNVQQRTRVPLEKTESQQPRQRTRVRLTK